MSLLSDPTPDELVMGSTYEETARPGHTVVIQKFSIRDGEQWVTYRHVGVHNKRAQRHPTITKVKWFKRRFVLVD